MPDKSQLKEKIIKFARETLGFDDCRFTDLKLDKAMDYYKKWLKDNDIGDMRYLREHANYKENPELLLERAQSAIVLSKNYKNTSEPKLKNRFKIARYAVGKDYHQVIKEKLLSLADYLKNVSPQTQCYCAVDSSPVAERSLAIKAGIGFLGKNTMVIKPGLGSYLFIGVILTDFAFEPDKPLAWNCGECRLCVDACPTLAINKDYTLTATKCISYQTIERKTLLTDHEIKTNKGWMFGCDICQEACPYNAGNIPLTDWEEFLPKSGVGFDFFDKVSREGTAPLIPKATPLYRSRGRVVPNVLRAFKILKDKHEP